MTVILYKVIDTTGFKIRAFLQSIAHSNQYQKAEIRPFQTCSTFLKC